MTGKPATGLEIPAYIKNPNLHGKFETLNEKPYLHAKPAPIRYTLTYMKTLTYRKNPNLNEKPALTQKTPAPTKKVTYRKTLIYKKKP